MGKNDSFETLTIDGHEVRISNPGKLYFSREVQLTKLDLVQYFLAVAPGALAGVRDRPLVLKRFVNGAHEEPFYQKRAPADHPEWVRTVTLSFPSGRTADEIVVDEAAGLAWVMNLGCMELHPHPVRTGNLEHPDQLRVDLDPGPAIPWADVRRAALEVRAVLEEHGLTGWPKTSGSRGMHINVPIEVRWSFTEVRRAALALSREVERRIPEIATSKWWKEERHGVFLDYNQNAKDRTTASAYSVRPLPDARVSAPLRWNEVEQCEPAEFTVQTMPARFLAVGDPHLGMEGSAGSLDALLELAVRDAAEGLGDAPWPPHFRKMEGEAARVQPSRARSGSKPATKGVEKNFDAQLGEGFGERRFRARSAALDQAGTASPESPAASAPDPTPKRIAAKRVPKFPLITVAQSPDQGAAQAGLERWQAVHAGIVPFLTPEDILVDRMRGSTYVWYRIRINLRHVPEDQRPRQTTPDPDDDPTRDRPRQTRRKTS